MTIREKIIILVTGVVVVVGLVMLKPMLFGEDEKEKPTLTAKDHKVFASAVRADVAANSLSLENKAILDIVSNSSLEDPFLVGLTPQEIIANEKKESKQSDEQLRVAPEDQKERNKYNFQGVVLMGRKRMALINGGEYFIGETIKGTEAIIQSIGDDEVILRYKEGTRKVSIPLSRKVLK